MKEVQPKKSQKRLVKLPPQESANDTSNWENRNVSAPTLDKITSKRVVREIEFIRNDDSSEDIIWKSAKVLPAQKHPKKNSK